MYISKAFLYDILNLWPRTGLQFVDTILAGLAEFGVLLPLGLQFCTCKLNCIS